MNSRNHMPIAEPSVVINAPIYISLPPPSHSYFKGHYHHYHQEENIPAADMQRKLQDREREKAELAELEK